MIHDTGSLENLVAHLKKARCPEDVFGESPGAIRSTFGSLMLVAHPDKYSEPAAQSSAREAFALLNTAHEQANAKVSAGTYGDRKPVAAPIAAPKHEPVSIKVGGKEYVVGHELARGDICDVYECGDGRVLKVARSAADNDFVQNEAQKLGKVHPAKVAEEKFYRFTPSVLDSFGIKGAKTTRRANVLPRYPEHFSLAQIHAAYPNGLDLRDSVWMFKRLLMAIGFAHEQGIVHGAIVPEHVLVHPTGHGARVIDWCYAVNVGERIKAISPGNRDLYAPEVLKKEPASAGTDVYMAAKSIALLLDKNAPARFQAFLSGCMLTNPARRPGAWQTHEELDALLFKLVGKPQYRPLRMPA